jgi:hypothetical protein
MAKRSPLRRASPPNNLLNCERKFAFANWRF